MVIILIESLCISDDFVSNNLVLLEIELLVSWGKYVYILIHWEFSTFQSSNLIMVLHYLIGSIN